LNLRPLGYEPSELPNCSTPRRCALTLGARAAGGKSQWPGQAPTDGAVGAASQIT
jgi:hypothetical protein